MHFCFRALPGLFGRRGALSALVLWLICGSAAADDLSAANSALRMMQIDESVKPQSDTPFGEQINPYIGSVSFKQADVVVPGKGPTISLVRETLTPRSHYRTLVPHPMGDWTLSVPQIHTMTGAPIGTMGIAGENWKVSDPGTPNEYKRCTQINESWTPGIVNTIWWDGIAMVTETGETQSILKRDPANTAKPTMSLNGQPVVFSAVTEKNWQIGCLPQTSNGELGEAFFVVSPDGTKYWFDHLIGEPLETIKEMDDGVIVRQGVMRARMFVTRIEDRFGNYLTYQYDGKRLTSITASDGRSVAIAWRADYNLVDSITVQPAASQPRVWRYEYANLGDTTSQLTGVVLPDLTRWSFNLHPQTSWVQTSLRPCGIRSGLPVSDTPAVQTLTSPSSLTGTFTYKQVWHARYVAGACVQMPNMDPYEETPALFTTQSLIDKKISGPGVAPQAWTYAYQPAVGAVSYDPCASNGTCPMTKWVDVTDPDAGRTRYTHSIVNGTDGRLLGNDTYQGATLLRSEKYDYAAANQGPWPVMLGSPMGNMNLAGAIFQWTPMKKRTIAQQGATFTWQVNTLDNFAQPLSVTRSNTLGYTRTDVTAYHHNTAKWVIGQVASSTNSNTGLVESKTDYDAASALPIRSYAFGKLQQTLTYNPDGTLLTAKDGNNNVTTFANWKRGIPQTITFADTRFKSAVVNDFGQMDSVTDENAYTTSYTYDPMGRLSKITYPGADSTAWNVTTLAFVPVAAAEVGLPAGHWRQTVSTGNGVKLTYFDALWRPLVTREYDAGNVAGTQRFQRFTYDHEGRTTFASYPGTTDALTTGTRTTYDALGRPTLVKQDSELGVLQTQTDYLNSGSAPYTRVIDPRGNPTNTWHQSFDVPRLDAPIKIQHPEGAYTDITRDVFGKPTALKRHNADGTVALTRSYGYDAHQQLCLTVEPETQATVMDYDGAGQLAWSAGGRALTAATPCDSARTSVADADRIKRSYDARLRLKTLSFPHGNGNQVWTYTPDGLPSQITTANDAGTSSVVNAYGYNKRRLLTGESQTQLGMPSWSLGYGYDGNGALASHTYPGGLAVAYAPNAVGQPTKAGSYATGVSYWPNGAMKQFTYGNGIVHTMTQNARQLPEHSLDSGGVLNDSYDYDQNGNVAAISDGLSGARGNRDMTYDGLDRLKTTTSPMLAGGAAYAYDVLDNLTRVKAPGRDHYYCYDTRWQLTNVKTGSCTGTSVIGLGYDAQGNLKNKNGVLYAFDAGNRLREVTGQETYRYDGYGRRVSAQSTQGAIYSLYGQDGALRYQRDERKAQAYDYIRLNGSLLARVTGQAVIVGVPIVTAPASSNTGTYTVSWTTVALATRYEAQEALNGGTWQAAYSGTATSLARSGKPSGSYGYRVRACRDTTCGNWSATATVAVNVPPASAPVLTAPATAANGNYSVTWTTVGGATSYTLEQSANDGAWAQAYSGAGISQSYSAQPAGSYGYRVKACNPVGCSAYSGTATVQAIYPPGAPTISAPAQSTNGSYTVSWTSVSGASSYRLEERVGAGAWAEIQNSTAVSKAFTGKADGSYGYRARACNAAGCGGYSATATVTVLTPPTAVATITTPASNTTGAYTVSWTAVAKATSYTLQRSANGGAWANAYSGANRTFAVSGQGEGSYGYRVQGCNGSGCGGWSATKTTQVMFVPAMPASLTGYAEASTPAGVRDFYVFWSAVSTATYYDVQETWTSAQVVYSGPLTDYLASGRGTRTYHVRACNSAGCSAWKGPLTL